MDRKLLCRVKWSLDSGKIGTPKFGRVGEETTKLM
jgi:hypothetical protein